MKKIFLMSVFAVILLIEIVSAADSIVFRTFSQEDVLISEIVDVTLHVSVINNETSYLIEEYIPQGWTIINSGGAVIINSNTLKWIVTENAEDTTYTYKIKAPDQKGNYAFSGIYRFEGTNTSSFMQGDIFIYVDVPIEPNPVEFDIAYIIKNTNSIDQTLVNLIDELGFTIGYVDDSEISSTDFSDYRLILITDENFGSYAKDIPVNDVKSLIINTYHLEDWNWIIGGVSQTGSSQALGVNVVDSQIKITQGLPYNFKVYTQAKENGVAIPMYFLSKQKRALEIKSIVSTENDYLDAVIAKTEIGTKLKNNKVANARSVFFGITKTEFWTSDTEQLFKNSIMWLTEGEDRDGDGYFTDEDCNDNNPDINPGKIEIPYDRTDNNCDGFDLADIDGDGYCKKDYMIMDKALQCPLETGLLGTDCNDNNSAINPGSSDSTKNCVNEAPIFSGTIPNFAWDEDKTSILLDLRTYFSDPDDDDLTFNISSTSNDQNITVLFLIGNKGLIRFESAENWHGSDWVIFSANDGEFTTESNKINLTVNSVNDAPVLEEISDIIINETDLIEINATAFDADGDVLVYSISDARFTNNGEGIFTWQTTYDDKGIYEIEINATDGELIDSQNVKITVKNLNRIPLVEDIPNQTLLEDEQKSISIIAEDLDNETLTYEVINKDANKVDCVFNENNLTMIPYLNWNGEASCEISITDREATVIKLFNITVIPVNDAPVLPNLEDIYADENDLIEINATTFDADGDVLVYSISDARFTNNGEGIFTWQTTYDDKGIYEIEINATDGELIDSKILRVIIDDKNEPPYISTINNITIDEDSGLNIFEDILSGSDNDGYISRFKIIEENLNQVHCEINGNDLGLTPAKDFNGIATCTIRAYDDDFDYSETTVKIIVNNVNDAPKIVSYNPNSSYILTTEDGAQKFSIEWEDIDTLEKYVKIKWYVDGLLEGVGNEYTFTSDGNIKEFNIKVIIDDSEKSDSIEWTIKTTNIPKVNLYDGETTDFSGMSEDELSSVNLVLEKTGFGKIEFLEPVDLRNVADLNSYSNIMNGLCSVDSGLYNVFKDKNARITFYNLNFEKTPTLYYNSGFTLNPLSITQICSSTICSDINYNNNEMSFVVNGFSSFMAGDTLTCEQKTGYICTENEVCKGNLIEARDSNSCCSTECTPYFKDAGTCETVDNNIILKIKNPSAKDKFKPGEIIEIEVKIKNVLDEGVYLDTEVFLYDLSEGETIEEDKEKIKIKSGESETVELNIEIPKDLEDIDNKFYIFVKTEDKDNRTICNEDYTEVNIDRESDDVIIENLKISPMIVSPGSILDVTVEVENIGSDEQEDIYVTLEIEELDIKEKSEEFDIEEFGEDDKKRLNFLLKIPKDAEEGTYSLKASVNFFGDEENYKLIDFEIVKNKDTQKIIEEKVIYISSAGQISEQIKGDFIESSTIKLENNKEESKTRIIYIIIAILVLLLLTIIIILLCLETYSIEQ
jgi:hypothetical protein